MYSCHLLISYSSVRFLPFLSSLVPIFAWNGALISPIFLKSFLVFPIVLFSSTSLHCAFKKASLSLLDIQYSLKWSEVTQSCPTLCDPMDCSLPGFSVHGIFQARVPEWVAFSFSRGSSWSRDRTQVSHIAGICFTLWATREAQYGLGTAKNELDSILLN